jgi:nucleoside 2-deoxyribosyltransferase
MVVFLPHRDAGLQIDGEESARSIYAADVAALDRADLVVANLDGADVDSGTAWEIGYAIARGKGAIGIRTDRRWLEPFSRVNLMIKQSVRVVLTMEALEEAIFDFLTIGRTP